jgi:hypothetical protein
MFLEGLGYDSLGTACRQSLSLFAFPEHLGGEVTYS